MDVTNIDMSYRHLDVLLHVKVRFQQFAIMFLRMSD